MRVRTVNVSIELLTDVSLKTLGDRHAWSVFENGYDITQRNTTIVGITARVQQPPKAKKKFDPRLPPYGPGKKARRT